MQYVQKKNISNEIFVSDLNCKKKKENPLYRKKNKAFNVKRIKTKA
jgi:hypothetical protein